MASLTFVPLADAATGAGAVDPTGPAQGGRVGGLDGAQRRLNGAIERAQEAQAGGAVSGVSQTEDAAARDRVRRSLELDGGKPVDGKAQEGDAILDGLQKLRGAFDAGQSRISEVMSANTVDAKTMLAMQMEMVNFSMLVDVTSKLTGKSTQSFDALMKGQ